MVIDRRNWGVWKFWLSAFVGALAISLAPILLFGRGGAAASVGTVRVLIPTGLAALAIAWAVWMASLSFRRLDEFQQQASKFAWYWGGSIGVAVSFVGFIFVGQGGMHWLDPAHYPLGRDLFRAFQWGYLLGIGTPMAGFLVARLVWKVTRR